MFLLLSKTLKPLHVAKTMETAMARAEKDSRVEFVRPCQIFSPFNPPSPETWRGEMCKPWLSGYVLFTFKDSHKFLVEE